MHKMFQNILDFAMTDESGIERFGDLIDAIVLNSSILIPIMVKDG